MMQGQTVYEMAVDKPLMTTKQCLSLMQSYEVDVRLEGWSCAGLLSQCVSVNVE